MLGLMGHAVWFWKFPKQSHLILILVPFLCQPLSAHLIQTTHCVHAGRVLVLNVRTDRERQRAIEREVRQKTKKNNSLHELNV